VQAVSDLLLAMILTYYFLSSLLTYSMEQSPSWEANRFSSSQESPTFYGTRKFSTAFTCARQLSLSWTSSILSYTLVCGPLSPRHGASPVCGWRNDVQYVLKKQSRTADKLWSSILGVELDTNNCWPYKLVLLRNMNTCLALSDHIFT